MTKITIKARLGWAQTAAHCAERYLTTYANDGRQRPRDCVLYSFSGKPEELFAVWGDHRHVRVRQQ